MAPGSTADRSGSETACTGSRTARSGRRAPPSRCGCARRARPESGPLHTALRVERYAVGGRRRGRPSIRIGRRRMRASIELLSTYCESNRHRRAGRRARRCSRSTPQSTRLTGDHIVLLDASVRVITPDWLQVMLELSQRDDIGAVGARLRYPDGAVAHEGIVLGRLGVADSVDQLLRVIKETSAVSGACLMTRRAVFDQRRRHRRRSTAARCSMSTTACVSVSWAFACSARRWRS